MIEIIHTLCLCINWNQRASDYCMYHNLVAEAVENMQTYINNKNTVGSDKIKNTKSSREQKLQKN